MECGICYSYRLESAIPDQMCNDPRCGQPFHQACLYEVRADLLYFHVVIAEPPMDLRNQPLLMVVNRLQLSVRKNIYKRAFVAPPEVKIIAGSRRMGQVFILKSCLISCSGYEGYRPVDKASTSCLESALTAARYHNIISCLRVGLPSITN